MIELTPILESPTLRTLQTPSPKTFQEFEHYYTETTGRRAPKALKKWFQFALEKECSFSDQFYSRIDMDLLPYRMQGGIPLKTIDEALKTIDRTGFVEFRQGKNITVSENIKSAPDFVLVEDLLKPIQHIIPDLRFVYNMLDEPRLLSKGISRASPGFFEIENGSDVRTVFLEEGVCADAIKSFKDSLGYFRSTTRFSIYLPEDTSPQLPVFSVTKIDGCFDDIILPGYCIFEDLKIIETSSVFLEKTSNSIWSNKLETLFWRGSTTGTAFKKANEIGWKESQRIHLARLTENVHRPVTWDVGISRISQCPKELCHDVEEYVWNAGKPQIKFHEHFRRKFLLDVEGNTYSRRFYMFLKAPSLDSASVVLRARAFQVFFDYIVKPMEHYVPIKLDFEDIDGKLAWLQKNDQMAKKIAEQGAELANRYLRLEDMQCYMSRLLIEYHSLIRE